MDELKIRQIFQEELQKRIQQIIYPLDETSRNIINEHVPVLSGTLVAGSPTTNGYILVMIDGQPFKIMTTA